jgi:hypothetical protein
MSNIDIGLAMQPLLSKTCETGYCVTLANDNTKQINRDA